MIEIGLREWLLSQTAIVSQLQGGGSEPVFIDDADAGIREHILVSLTDGEYAPTMDSDDQAHNDLIDEEVDVDVKCETLGRAKQFGKAILDVLFPKEGDNYTGSMGDRVCEAVSLENVKTGYEQPQSGEKKGRHVMQITLRIHNRGE